MGRLVQAHDARAVRPLHVDRHPLADGGKGVRQCRRDPTDRAGSTSPAVSAGLEHDPTTGAESGGGHSGAGGTKLSIDSLSACANDPCNRPVVPAKVDVPHRAVAEITLPQEIAGTIPLIDLLIEARREPRILLYRERLDEAR